MAFETAREKQYPVDYVETSNPKKGVAVAGCTLAWPTVKLTWLYVPMSKPIRAEQPYILTSFVVSSMIYNREPCTEGC